MLISCPILFLAGAWGISITFHYPTNSCGNQCSPALSVGEHSPVGTWVSDLVACKMRARPLGEKFSPRGNTQLGDESITEARVHWPTPAGKRVVSRVVQDRTIAGIS